MDSSFQPVQFGRFLLTNRIAVGGMAEIFNAKVQGAMGFEKSMVIKRILPQYADDHEFVRMFVTEAKLVCHLEHPNIVQVHELGQINGQYFIAMEAVQGIDARELWRTLAARKQRLPGVLSLYIVSEFLKGLDYAHRAVGPDGQLLGVVHRDVSPSNVLISFRGDVKVVDFGIALVEHESRTQAGVLKGKYGYMSPEQVSGMKVDHRSDIFSAGIVLAELLLGRRLFLGRNDFETLDRVLNVRLEVLEENASALQPEVVAILKRALRREPIERYQSAREFHDAIMELLFAQGKRITNETLAAFLAQHVVPFLALRRASAEAVISTPSLPSPTVPSSGIARPAAVPEAPRTAADAETADGRETSSRTPEPPTAAEAGDLDEPETSNRRPKDPWSARSLATGEPEEARLVFRPTRDSVEQIPAITLEAEPPDLTDEPAAQAPVMVAPAASEPPQNEPDIEPEKPSDEYPVAPRRQAPVETRAEAPSEPSLSPQTIGTQDLIEPGDDVVEIDFSELGQAEPPSGTGEKARPTRSGPLSSGLMHQVLTEAEQPRIGLVPDFRGKLKNRSVTKVLFRFHVVSESGLLALSGPPPGGEQAELLLWLTQLRLRLQATWSESPSTQQLTCELIFEKGNPHLASADRNEEDLVAFLVCTGVLTRGQVEAAIRANAQRGLVAALLASGDLAPLQVSRHITAMVLKRVLDMFAWQSGSFAFYRGRMSAGEAFPTGVEGLDLLTQGVANLPDAFLERYFQGIGSQRLVPNRKPPTWIGAFKPDEAQKMVYRAIGEGLTVQTVLERCASQFSLPKARQALYLLLECDMALLRGPG